MYTYDISADRVSNIRMPTFSIPGANTPPPPAKKTNNRRKKTAQPQPEPELEPEPEPEPLPVTVNDCESEAEPKEDLARVDDKDPNSPLSEPTFPNIVILKQTEHNYIVKHNHYPVVSSLSHHNNAHLQPLVTDDLVSPNQIHKGQLNKKRGRKPKAGIILNSKGSIYDTTEVPNIILHLKCHLIDLKTNELISKYEYTPAISEVESYTSQSNYHQPSDIVTQKTNDIPDDDDDDDIEGMENVILHDSEYNVSVSANHSECVATNVNTFRNNNSRCGDISTSISVPTTHDNNTSQTNAKKQATEATVQIINDRNQKEIMKKIHRLKYSFHNGETVQTKMNHRPACFWDTCEFDGPIYYIPIMIVNGVFQVNGCYCSPQCAVAALLKESIDTSTKFERLHLLHLLYGVPNSKGFKPAPNPHYLLDKYYGNLTIQEYRTLLKGTQMIHIVNKPLTHILPELYEDNNDFLVNSKVIPANSLKMKKKYKTMVVQSGAE
jgi:hypothetical protein